MGFMCELFTYVGRQRVFFWCIGCSRLMCMITFDD
jgi:hypothetical protein